MSSPPDKEAIRFAVQQYDEKRDDVPGGCIILERQEWKS